MGLESITTMWWVIIGVLTVAGLWAAFTLEKRQKSPIGMKRNPFVSLTLGVAAVFLLLQGGFLAGMGLNPLAIAEGGTDGGDGVIEGSGNLEADILGCDLGTKTTVTLAGQDFYTGNAVGGTHRYKVNGAPASTVSDAGTFTASPGDSIEIMWMNETSASYYGLIETVTVPCTGAKTFSQSLYNNGTFTVQIFNEDDNSIDNASGGTGITEALAAGDVVTLDANIKIVFEAAAPYGGVFYANYNTSAFDKVTMDFGGEPVSAPSAVLVPPRSTQHSVVAVSVPPFFSTDKVFGKITIDVDDTLDPDGLTVTGTNMSFAFRPYNVFVNGDTAGSFDAPAVEDEDDVATQTNLRELTIGIA